MPGFELHTWIDRPPAAVWAALTDLEDAGRWMPGVEFIALDEEGPVEVGTVYRFRVEGLKRELMKGTVMALKPRRELMLSTTRGNITAVYTYRLASKDGGCAVTMKAECQVDGWLDFLTPLFVFIMKRGDRGLLDALKHHLEAGPDTRQNAPESIQESHSRTAPD